MRFLHRENTPDTAVNEDPEIRKNRISGIEIPEEASGPRFRLPSRFPIKQVGIISGILLALILGIVIITQFVYKRPQIFTPTNKGDLAMDSVNKEIGLQSDNIHIKRGRESYARGYITDAVTEFNEVVDSGAPDADKAIALAYLGIIADDRGEFDKAVDFYTRALKYDRKNADIYRNLSVAYKHKKDYGRALETAKESISLNEKDPKSQNLMGDIYFEQGRYQDAIGQYEDSLKKSPDNPKILYNMAMALLQKGDEFAATEYLKKAAAADRIGEVASRAYSRLGVMFMERRDYDQAEKYLKEGALIRPEDPLLHYNLGVAYMQQKKTDQALVELSRAEELGARDATIMENIADTYYGMRQFDRSLGLYKQLAQVNTRNIRILSRLGEIYYERGELDKAFDIYKRITVMEPLTENARVAYLNMGNILDDSQRFDEAIEMYYKALAISPKDDAVHYNLGIAFKHAGRPEKAIDAWRAAAELATNDPRPLLATADLYYDRGFFDQAEIEYQRILARWPQIQEAHFKMGTIYYKRNQVGYALKAYNKVLEINDKNELARKALINLGVLQSKTARNENDYQKAAMQVQKALLIKPGDSESLYALGLLYSRKEMHDKAIETFYQVIRASRDPKILGESYNNIGIAYFKKRQFKKALQAFTRGVEEDPSNEEIRLNRKSAMQSYETQLGR